MFKVDELVKATAGAKTRAVIYTRVSSASQVKRGDGLGSQEARCREYAEIKGYGIAAVFSDDISGSLTSRPGFDQMLAFLSEHDDWEPVVIIDDISRLARGVEQHIQLRKT